MRASVVLSCVIVLLLATVSAAPAATPQPIDIRVRALTLDTSEPERTRVGRLEYRGGLELTSSDRRFGGLSGMLVSPDGARLTAVSDKGWLVRADLVYDSAGVLVGVENATLGALLSRKGDSLGGRPAGDAESLTRGPAGSLLVGFEHGHRILAYPADGGLPTPVATPEALQQAPRNEGLELLTRLPDGRMLAVTENLPVPGGTAGWVRDRRGEWAALTWPTSGGFRPTDAAVLPDGDVLVLERRFPPLGVHVRTLPTATIKAGAVLESTLVAAFEGSLSFDNMEAVGVRRAADGSTLVYLLSDDNYNILQRTLLMMFRLLPE